MLRRKRCGRSTSNIKALLDRKQKTTCAPAAESGRSDKTILRACSGPMVVCGLYTLQTIAKHPACQVKDLSPEQLRKEGMVLKNKVAASRNQR